MPIFSRKASKRIARAVKRSEGNQRQLHAPRKRTYPTSGGGSPKPVRIQALNADWASETQGDKEVNAKVVDSDPIKYLSVDPQLSDGFTFANMTHLAAKVNGVWYVVTHGIMYAKAILTGDQATSGERTAEADLYFVNDGSLKEENKLNAEAVAIFGRGRFTGLKADTVVEVVHSGGFGGAWWVSAIQGEYASGTWGSTNSDSGAAYAFTNPMNWSLADGQSVYGIWNAGSYHVIAAGCN